MTRHHLTVPVPLLARLRAYMATTGTPGLSEAIRVLLHEALTARGVPQ